jgi:hypothetical protein
MGLTHPGKFGCPAEEIVAVARHENASVSGCEPELFIVAKFGVAAIIDADRIKSQSPSYPGNLWRDVGVEQEAIGKSRF